MQNRASSLFPLLIILVAVSLLACQEPASAETTVDRVLVIKNEKKLVLLSNGTEVKSYRVALGRKDGAKVRQGDHRTPEGVYLLDRRNVKSRFYRALHISYPNGDDRARAHRSGAAPGGDIMIHGLPKGFADLGDLHAERNWTKGCIALTNVQMDEIWRLVRDGTPIEIVP